MNPGNKHSQNKTKKFEDLKNVDSFMDQLSQLIEGLNSKFRILPKVDDKGQSECPFAEDLYAEKEKAAKEVSKKLKEASRYADLLKQEIARFRRNLSKIGADAGSLNSVQAKEKYASAKKAQEFHIDKNDKRLRKLTDLIAKAEKLLQVALEKKWPLGEPKKSFHPSQPPVDRKVSTGTPIQGAMQGKPYRPSFKTESDSLIAIGPLGGKQI